MKIIIDENIEYDQEELVIKCPAVNQKILDIIATAKSYDSSSIIGFDEKKSIHMISPADIYYFESVDEKIFFYTKADFFECRERLFEIEKKLCNLYFIRISKSVIINLKLVKILNPLFNGKIEAVLDNGEKQIISRQYSQILKQKLGLGGK